MLPPLPRCSRWAYLSLKNRPSVSAFPDSTFGSACTSTFSRIARRLLALRPAHSRGHQFRDRYPGASDISSPPCLPRLLPAGAVAGRGLHPLDKRRLVTAHVVSSRSPGRASLVRPWLCFHIPLIEPDRRIYRIRLSDKTSRRHPRRAATKLGQAYEPEVLVKVREWIGSALASPDFVLEAQPPAQPHSRVVVEHPIRFAGGSNAKVIGPSAQRVVQLIHQPCGLLPSTRSVGQRVDSFDHALMLFFDGR